MVKLKLFLLAVVVALGVTCGASWQSFGEETAAPTKIFQPEGWSWGD